MDPFVVTLISFIIIFLALFSGMWIFVGLGISGLICAAFFQGSMAALPYIIFDSANSFTLTAILTFVLMGEILLRSELSLILFRGASALLRFLPGCLYHSVIVASAIFAATSGSSIASAATIGRIALPELHDRGYNREIALGSVGGGSMLANFIPPSLGFIIYGACTLESVSRLFMAGVIPGVVLALMMMVYIGINVKIHPHYVPPLPPPNFKQDIKDIANLVPVVALAGAVLGSIYGGLATPTEAGTVGVMGALILSAAHRKLRWKTLRDSLFGTVKVTSMVMILIIAGYLMGGVYGALGLPKAVMDWVTRADLSPLAVLTGVIVFYTIMGMFLETIPVFIMSIGIIYPLLINLGYNGIWFGVLSGIVLTVGLLTPPVGMVLYVMQGIPPYCSLGKAAKGCFPFIIIHYIMIAMLILWPQLATWLPNYVFGAKG